MRVRKQILEAIATGHYTPRENVAARQCAIGAITPIAPF